MVGGANIGTGRRVFHSNRQLFVSEAGACEARACEAGACKAFASVASDQSFTPHDHWTSGRPHIVTGHRRALDAKLPNLI